jgi:hypothetical protein
MNTYKSMIKSIWTDESISYCYTRRNNFYLNDSTEFFMLNIERICSKEYVPDIDDLLRVRQPTTSIIEYKFKLSGTYFLFVDVGGQRSERRKWINCFENVTSLLFVASLSDYDLTMSKDEVRNANANNNNNNNNNNGTSVNVNGKRNILFYLLQLLFIYSRVFKRQAVVCIYCMGLVFK